MDTVTALIGAAWLAIGAMLVFGVVDALRKVFASDAPLPFFRSIERRGLTLAGMEQAIGARQLARAVRRCALCPARRDCERGAAVNCPNEEVFRRAASLRAA